MTPSRSSALTALLLLTTLLMVACGSAEPATDTATTTSTDTPAEAPTDDEPTLEDSTEEAATEEDATEGGAAETAGGPTITDVRGNVIAVGAPVERVVCLVSLCEDMLLEVGLEPVARTGMLLEDERFMGTAAAAVPQVPGGFLDPDLEALVSFEPDLVIGLVGAHDQLQAPLETTAPLWLVDPNDIEESVRYLEDFGVLADRQDEAAEAEARFRDLLAQAEASNRPDVTALLVFGVDGDFEVSVGGYLGDVMSRLFDYPWEAREGALGGAPYSTEEILATGTDVIFALTYNADDSLPSLSEQLADDPVLQSLTAVQQDAVFEVSTDVWGNGRGTRSLGIVLEEALEALEGLGT